MQERLHARPCDAGPSAHEAGRWKPTVPLFVLALVALLALPGVASAQNSSEPAPARINLWVWGAGGGDVTVGKRARLKGVMRPFVAGQRVIVVVKRGRKTIKRVSRPVGRIAGRNKGSFRARTPRLIRPARYRFLVRHPRTAEQLSARAKSSRFSVSYPNLDAGDRGRAVRIFNNLLARQRYRPSRGPSYGGATMRAVMAFRKVNGMPRTYDAGRGIFKRLAARRGGFRLARPRARRHVEVDLSRQVMVLAARGKARHIFHVSTGAPATPSDPGRFRFYRRQPGYNSLGMYYSVYYNGGEAIHGYRSVPPWAASHGCIRNPTPDSRFIYNWVRLGMRIYVYP